MNNDDIDKIKHAITNYTNITEMRDIREIFYPRNFDFPFFFNEIYVLYFIWFSITIIVMLIIYFFNIFCQD